MPYSPLRPQPDYGENPHDASSIDFWLKEASTSDDLIQPEEDNFFAELAKEMNSHKAFSSSYLYTPEGNASPSILPHNVHIDAEQDSQFMRMDQDNLSPTQGLAANVMKTALLEQTTQDLKNLATQAQQATQALKQVTPAPSGSTPAPSGSTPTPSTGSGASTQPTTPPPGTAPSTAPTAQQQAASKPIPQNPPGTPPSPVGKTGGLIHEAWFQSNPFMQYNMQINASPLNSGEGQYNNMSYNPRPSYFQEGSGDSNFADMHAAPNGSYTPESLTFGGVTDMLEVPPADPRWTNDPEVLHEEMPISVHTVPNPRTAALSNLLDDVILKTSRRLSNDDNPFIKDYSEVRPLNDTSLSVNSPQMDPNKPNDPVDSTDTLHQTQPRLRSIGPQGPLAQFDPNQLTADPYIETVCPASADGTRYSIPSFKTQRPAPTLPSFDFIKDH